MVTSAAMTTYFLFFWTRVLKCLCFIVQTHTLHTNTRRCKGKKIEPPPRWKQFQCYEHSFYSLRVTCEFYRNYAVTRYQPWYTITAPLSFLSHTQKQQETRARDHSITKSQTIKPTLQSYTSQLEKISLSISFLLERKQTLDWNMAYLMLQCFKITQYQSFEAGIAFKNNKCV